MKRFSLILLLVIACAITYAQDARSLIKEGADLSSAKQYTAAIEKYKAALVIEPNNPQANYQLAFALNQTGKSTDAIPYLQKATTGDASANMKSGAYALLGSIYDQAKQPAKAIENYKQALTLTPDDQQLQYNLGLAFFRNHQYVEAEQCAINSLKLAPQHSASMRLYALVAFHQNKRAPALLGLCSFLLMEPNTPRSSESYSNIQHIIQGGDLKPEPGEVAPHHIDAETNALNQAISSAVATEAKRRYFVAADKFTQQLQAIFAAIGPLAEKQQHGSELFKAPAARFYKLSQSGNMPAFARLISQSSDKASVAWIAAHSDEMGKLDEWLKGN
ncbi:TPR repeat protein [Mucilaginibacter yixingensis]|uniref:TPR repeat protein n=1 Tax=Mucilaginibacter yixingensis TaxID=1295612 RepID=A0A2T5JDL4_9SPHI|nr:tetratricopeptide repeat protein [Mucilaginibacter yixingensis]PTQ99859.1 TPR repeat protein [Mucilaginibacter yixingensis]